MFFKWIFFLLSISYALLINSCGMNTDLSARLTPLSYPPASTPAITSLSFINTEIGTRQFEIEYYVTNEEADFLGYNLYINTVPVSSERFLLEQNENIYLERGVQPSFSHVDDPLSTEPADIKRQRLNYRKPPPVPEAFYECLLYFFRIRAYLRGGFESEASEEMQACASSDPSSCPSGTTCNP